MESKNLFTYIGQDEHPVCTLQQTLSLLGLVSNALEIYRANPNETRANVLFRDITYGSLEFDMFCAIRRLFFQRLLHHSQSESSLAMTNVDEDTSLASVQAKDVASEAVKCFDRVHAQLFRASTLQRPWFARLAQQTDARDPANFPRENVVYKGFVTLSDVLDVLANQVDAVEQTYRQTMLKLQAVRRDTRTLNTASYIQRQMQHHVQRVHSNV